MTITPLSKLPIRTAASIILLIWILLYAEILYDIFHLPWQIAIADSIITNGLLAISCIVISNMLNYYQPGKQLYIYILLIVLVLSIFNILFSKFILTTIFANESGYIAFLDTATFINFGFDMVVLAWCAIANLLWYKVMEQSEITQQKLTAQNLAKEAELNKLRHQLQPHFLFNSLNSVYALTITNPPEAGKMIMKLSSFLRGNLKREDTIWVSIEEEMEYIQLYLEIEKVRFSHRLSIDVKVEEETKNMQIPGTVLQPIIENAIKFGLYNTSSAITISVNVINNQNNLIIEVSNPYDPEMKVAKGTGFGLSAIRRRLYLIFADNNLLKTASKDNNLYITTLKIPQIHD